MGISVVLDVGHGFNTAGKRTPVLSKTLKRTYENVCLNAPKGTQIREHLPACGVAHFQELELQKYGFKVLKSGWTSYAHATEDIALTDASKDVISRQNKSST